MKKVPTLNQKGFEPILIVVIVLVVAALGFGTYVFMQKQDTAKTTPETSTSTTQESELNDESKALDTAESDINSTLDDGSLDEDLNSVL